MTDQELRKAAMDRFDYDPETGEFSWKEGTKYQRKNKKPGTYDKDGYWMLCINGVKYRSHRVAFLITNGYLPAVVDHKNRDRIDNRSLNLRDATVKQNVHNSAGNIRSTSKYKGVCWYKITSKWIASIQSNGKSIHIGYYHNEVDAALAYNEAALHHFGEGAYMNPLH